MIFFEINDATRGYTGFLHTLRRRLRLGLAAAVGKTSSIGLVDPSAFKTAFYRLCILIDDLDMLAVLNSCD